MASNSNQRLLTEGNAKRVTLNAPLKPVKDTYTDNARLILELLKSADQSTYAKAKQVREAPSISFHVYPRQIVVECNEDGLTRKGLSAATGEETCPWFQDVFSIASKVHVKSGDYSLSLAYKSECSGMEIPSTRLQGEDGPGEHSTRVMVHLDGDAGGLQGLNESIRAQLLEIKETILLFLNKIRKIYVAFYDGPGQLTTSTAYAATYTGKTHATITTREVTNGQELEHINHFYIVRHRAEVDEYGDVLNAKVTLAFPVSKDSVPIIKNQALYYFLPIQGLGLSFIIHADFDTDPSGKHILQDSRRNNDLRPKIPGAFMKAVWLFCCHDTLKYQWVRYLPNNHDIRDPFRRAIIEGLMLQVGWNSVIFGRNNPNKRRIDNLYRIDDTLLNEDGELLFNDSLPEKIISQQYTPDDLDILCKYGLKYAGPKQIIEWIKTDLKAGRKSRLKSKHSTADWHARATKVLCLLLDHDDTLEELQSLELVPLEDGTWTSASPDSVYFPTTSGLDIPLDLKIKLVSREVTDPDRLEFLRRLGVKTASLQYVRRKILQEYIDLDLDLGFNKCKIDPASSKEHLTFLYLTEHSIGETEASYSVLALYADTEIVYRPKNTNIHIPNDDTYGAKKIYHDINLDEALFTHGENHVLFVHGEYFVNPPPQPYTQKLTWQEWFFKRLRVDRYICFDSKYGLTTAAEDINDYRPEKFMGALHAWYSTSGEISEDCLSVLEETKVLCQGNQRGKLGNVFLHTEELERRVEGYIGKGTFFPWLWIDPEIDVDSPTWATLLEELRITPMDDIKLALGMLYYFINAFQDKGPSRDRLFNLYYHVQDRCQESSNEEDVHTKYERYSFTKPVYIPISSTAYLWTTPKNCVWTAPQKMNTVFDLERLYQPYARQESEDNLLDYLFKNVLRVPDSTWQNYIEELDWFKKSNCTDIHAIMGMYKALDDVRSELDEYDRDTIRRRIEKYQLIYVPASDKPAWHKTSGCVWSCTAKLKRRISVNEHYLGLRAFFVEFLGVKQVELAMIIDELNEICGQRPVSEDEAVSFIWAINSLLEQETELPDPAHVLQYEVFPIKSPDGTVTCCSIATSFFIADREELRRSFGKKVRILNFTLHELARLEPFLEWTRLQRRKMSLCVREISALQGGEAFLISRPDRQVRNRAHALLRVASHFRSPQSKNTQDLENFYETQRSVNIYAANGVVSMLQLSQDGKIYEAKSKKTTLFLDEDDSSLRIYLPRNDDDQAYAFTKLLAPRLFEWMMMDEPTLLSDRSNFAGVNAVRDVLLAPCSKLDMALDDNCISTIQIQNRDGGGSASDETTGTSQGLSSDSELSISDSSSDI